MTPEMLAEQLGLHGLQDRKWFIQGSCATSGDGIFEGLLWLQSRLAAAATGITLPEKALAATAKKPAAEVLQSKGDSAPKTAEEDIAGSASDTESTVDTEAANEDDSSRLVQVVR